MICLILSNTIILGPLNWNPSGPWYENLLWQKLLDLGFGLKDSGLLNPDGTSLVLPAEEPTAAIALAGGYSIWPVTVTPDAPASGQIVTGHTTTVASGVVTVTPVYGVAPVVTPSSQIAKVDFLKRFQSKELIAAKGLEATDTTIALFWEQFRAITNFVDLSDQDVTQAVDYMVTKNVLTADRATAILTP